MTPDLPAADGSSPKTQRFDGPPAHVHRPGQALHGRDGDLQGHDDHRPRPASPRPATVNNFVFLARCHYYDGIVFHRIIPGFVLQGGDPEGRAGAAPATGSTTSCRPRAATRSARWPWPTPGPTPTAASSSSSAGPTGVALPPQLLAVRQGGRRARRGRAPSRPSAPVGRATERVAIESVTITEAD